MKYPKHYLDEIRQRLRVSDVVGKFVTLKKRGKEFIGLSPFKNERTPSFTINNEKGFYHCFSTGEHGNIFDFLMKTQSLGFGDTVKILAQQAGLPPYKFTKENKEQDERYLKYVSIYKQYNKICVENLFKHPKVYEYLVHRGLNKQVIEEFEIGYVPQASSISQTYLKDFSEKELIATGIFYKNEKKNILIDRFFERITFPISNLQNDIVAFGGRTLKKQENYAKYINSPETEFYKKGYMLFNLNKAKLNKDPKNTVIVVEGYMDAISLYAKGIKNVVSNQGTSITENQTSILWRFFKEINICLDGDLSGKKASIRIAEKIIPFISNNKKVSFVILNDAKDPDEFVNRYGKTKFEELLKNSISIDDYIWSYKLSEIDQNDIYEMSNFEKEMKKIYSTVIDDVLKKYLFNKLTQKLNVSPVRRSYSNVRYQSRKQKLHFLSNTKKIFNLKKNMSRQSILEFTLFFLMIHYPVIAKKNFSKIEQLEFENEKFKKFILDKINQNSSREEILESCNSHYPEDIKKIEDRDTPIKLIMKSKKTLDEQNLVFEEVINDYNEHLKNTELKKIEEKLTSEMNENSLNQFLEIKKQLNN